MRKVPRRQDGQGERRRRLCCVRSVHGPLLPLSGDYVPDDDDSDPLGLTLRPLRPLAGCPTVRSTPRRAVGHQAEAAQLLPVDRRPLRRCVWCSARACKGIGSRMAACALRRCVPHSGLGRTAHCLPLLKACFPRRGRFSLRSRVKMGASGSARKRSVAGTRRVWCSVRSWCWVCPCVYRCVCGSLWDDAPDCD